MPSRRLGQDPQLAAVRLGRVLLARGGRGSGVAQVQDLLATIGVPLTRSVTRRGADGIFGPETEAAVRVFQQRQGLKADGIVGPKTLAALDALVLGNPALEAPDPAREAALAHFDRAAPVSQKRHVVL